MIQGSPEWLQARCGNATASEFRCILAKSKEARLRAGYLQRIVVERLTQKPAETFSGPGTRRGEAQEPRGRMAYEAATGRLVEEVGFIKHPEIAAGASPDGLVGDDGGIEIKCVIPTVQLDTLMTGGCPSQHLAQIQGNLWITGRAWWDFISFCPDMPAHLRLYIHRLQRDDAYIETLEAEVRKFLAEVDRTVDALNGVDRLEDQLRASLVAA